MRRFILSSILIAMLYQPIAMAIHFMVGIDPILIQAAEHGYQKIESPHSNDMIIVDFRKPSNQKRLFLIDMKTHQIKLKTYVAHGSGSGMYSVDHLSNQAHSHRSSIGFFTTGALYQGKHGLSIKLDGLEPGFNDHASRRGIVIHAAPYVSNKTLRQLNRMGRSWGCFAVSEKDLKILIESSKEKKLPLMAYYPSRHWIQKSHFLND
ncbi:MAG: peptidase [Legionellales bacterium]|nr:peptidase [Legionellales bacterium]|tara:strand:- start:162 stop:782 length:621 start_codon:yes stop_codon:yes gene_type:complete